jgi:hypothetical protein
MPDSTRTNPELSYRTVSAAACNRGASVPASIIRRSAGAFLAPGWALPAKARNKVFMLAPVQGKLCPFCGLSTDVPHETQQGCIDALHAEIAHMRDLLDTVKPVSAENTSEGGEATETRPQHDSGRDPS